MARSRGRGRPSLASTRDAPVTTTEPRVERAPSTNAAGVVAVLSAAAIWSVGGVLGKSAHAEGIVLSFWRLWIASAVMVLIVARTRRWPSRADVRASFVAGVLFGLNLCVFFITLEHTTIAVALIIGALSPVVALPIATMFMGEQLTAVKVVCALLAVAGVVAAVATAPPDEQGHTTQLVGYLWAVAALMVWVLYLLQTKRVRSRVDTVPYMACVTWIGAVTASVLVVATRSELDQIHGRGWLWVTLLAIGPGLAGHGLVAWAQPRVDASVTSVLIQLEPVGASVAAWVVLGESMSLLQGLAMALVVAALCTLAYSESREGTVALDEGLG